MRTLLAIVASQKNVKAWANSINLLEAVRYMNGAGFYDAGMVVSGLNGSVVNSTNTQITNGTTYSLGGAVPNGTRGHACNGTVNDGRIAFGISSDTNLNYYYNGTAWSTQTGGGNRRWVSSAGSSSDMIVMGGGVDSNTTSTTVQKWNNVSWSTFASLNIAIQQTTGSGYSSSDGFTCSGSASAAAQTTDGVSFTTRGNLTIATGFNMSTGSNAASNSTTVFGGSASTQACAYFNGLTFATLNALAGAKEMGAGFGNFSYVIAAGGQSTPVVNTQLFRSV